MYDISLPNLPHKSTIHVGKIYHSHGSVMGFWNAWKTLKSFRKKNGEVRILENPPPRISQRLCWRQIVWVGLWTINVPWAKSKRSDMIKDMYIYINIYVYYVYSNRYGWNIYIYTYVYSDAKTFGPCHKLKESCRFLQRLISKFQKFQILLVREMCMKLHFLESSLCQWSWLNGSHLPRRNRALKGKLSPYNPNVSGATPEKIIPPGKDQWRSPLPLVLVSYGPW